MLISMDELPLEILMEIALKSVCAYKHMLALPPVARYSLEHRKYIINNFTYRKYTGRFVGYYLNGRLHREGLPAAEWADGGTEWYQGDKLHRDGDLPAVEYTNGHKAWYREGKLHRSGDLPAVISPDGEEWYWEGKRHRVKKPAVKWADGDREWWLNGERYRAGNLPPTVRADGTPVYYNKDRI